jgi:hypothetical protein
MKTQKLKINVQLKTTKAEKKLILLYINMGSYKTMEEYEMLDAGDITGWLSGNKKLYKPFVISSRLSLPEGFFDRETKICSSPFEHYNDKIKALIKSIHLLYDSITKNGKVILPDDFKRKINEYLFQEAEQQEETTFKEKKKSIYKNVEKLSKQKEVYISAPTRFTDYITWKVDDWKRNDPRSSYRFYNRFKNWVVKFQDEVLGGRELDILKLEISDLKQFKEFILNSKTEKGEPFTLNGVNLMLQGWRTFLNEARDEDEIPLQINIKKKFMKKVTEEEDDIALTKSQLEKIKALQFDDEQPMEQVRDLFLIGTCCGFRYSDLRYVKLYMRNGEHMFKTTNEKTDIKVEVPILRGNEFAISIFKKYDGNIPAYSPEFFNEQIKFIGQRAGLKDKIEVSKINPKTTKQEKDYFETYKLLSSKTCRKTFCTNLIEVHELPLPICMSFSGHRTEKSFRNYVRISAEKYHKLALKWQKMQESYLGKAV